MHKFYTDEKNILLLIALLKAHGVKKVVASPGSTNMSFVGSIQHDEFFEIYSCVDERSAAYMACGLAEESGEPVIISCTGATASRNYPSALTEAYYRKLPILAVTSMRHQGEMYQNIPQAIDRSIISNDIAKKSYLIPSFESEKDKAIYTTLINEAILELSHRGKGPVHINLATTYSEIYDVEHLPSVRVIKRYTPSDTLPQITAKRIGIFVGSHSKWTESQVKAVEKFCDRYGAVVLCDRTSNYFGRHRILPSLVVSQKKYRASCKTMDLLISIGDISGSYFHFDIKEMWRVNPDGCIRDFEKKLHYVFEFEEEKFFNVYADNTISSLSDNYEKEWVEELNTLNANVPELPFSHIWAAQQTLAKLPNNSVLHLGILSSLRNWNFFEPKNTVFGYCNTGGFGIDGCVSTLIGASLANKQSIYYGVVGDLAFFYDMNSLGNRHIGNNVRLIVVNNGRGQEFCNYAHPGSKFEGEEVKYIAAGGHFGRKSPLLLKHYAEDLGFKYLSASDKSEFEEAINLFACPDACDKPMLFELFTDGDAESEALQIMYNLQVDSSIAMKEAVKSALGDSTIKKIKGILRR